MSTPKANRGCHYVLYLLFFCVFALTIFGLVMLYSTTVSMYGEQMLKRQALWIVIGIVAALCIHRIDYRIWGQRSSLILVLISIPLIYLLLIHVLVRWGVSNDIISRFPFVGKGAIKGAYRWLTIGNRTVQPSEFAKLAIILFLAKYFGTNPRYVNSFRTGILRPTMVVGAVLLAILLGGSLSITVITACVVMGIMFVAGIRLRYFVILIACAGTLFAAVVMVSPVRASRFTSFRNPEKYKETIGYQLYSSQLALGSGGWNGVGFNQSRMKEFYLPEAHTDFIMAIVGEELGFTAMILVIAGYLALVAVIFHISYLAVDKEGMLLAFGIGLSIGLHALINISVVSGFAPTTGVTAPLVSYGGSNMLMTWISIGLLWNIVRVIDSAGDQSSSTPLRMRPPTVRASV